MVALPLSFFKHMKSQSMMPLCPFNVHDKTAWLQSQSKTFIQKKKIQEETLTKKQTKNYTYGYSKKPQQEVLEWTQDC